MYCHNCGKEISEGIQFCPYCGTNLNGGPQPSSSANAPATSGEAAENKPPKVWTVFSRIGKILGIVCLATSILPYLNYFSLALGVVGIVMSCLGKKAKTEETDKACRLGLILSIIAVAVSFIMVIVYYVALLEMLGELFSYEIYYA